MPGSSRRKVVYQRNGGDGRVLSIGAKVSAKWIDGQVYYAKVVSFPVNEELVKVVFDDGITSSVKACQCVTTTPLFITECNFITSFTETCLYTTSPLPLVPSSYPIIENVASTEAIIETIQHSVCANLSKVKVEVKPLRDRKTNLRQKILMFEATGNKKVAKWIAKNNMGLIKGETVEVDLDSLTELQVDKLESVIANVGKKKRRRTMVKKTTNETARSSPQERPISATGNTDVVKWIAKNDIGLIKGETVDVDLDSLTELQVDKLESVIANVGKKKRKRRMVKKTTNETTRSSPQERPILVKPTKRSDSEAEDCTYDSDEDPEYGPSSSSSCDTYDDDFHRNYSQQSSQLRKRSLDPCKVGKPQRKRRMLRETCKESASSSQQQRLCSELGIKGGITDLKDNCTYGNNEGLKHGPSSATSSNAIDGDFRNLQTDSSLQSGETVWHHRKGKQVHAGAYRSKLANVTIPVYSRLDGKKNYTKVDYCYFCEKAIKSKISRHYKGIHGEQKAVKSAMLKAGKEVDAEFVKIQNLGNFKHNEKVLRQGEGVLVVVKRPPKQVPAYNYLPCTYCYGFYSKKSLPKHILHTCVARERNKDDDGGRMFNDCEAFLSAYLQPSKADDEAMEEVMQGLSETNAHPGLLKTIKSDRLIREFGKGLLLKLGERQLQRPGSKDLNNIRNKMRVLARLLLHAKDANQDIDCYLTLLLPKNFDFLLAAARKLSTENEQIGLSVGSYIKQVNLQIISDSIKSGNYLGRFNGENFRFLFDCHWKNHVTAVAGKRQQLKALNKHQELPLTSDLRKLTEFLKTSILSHCNKDLTHLSKLCLAFLILFNKRRPMEVAEITISDYLAEYQHNSHDNEEIVASLDATERAISQRMRAIEVRGKSTRGLRKVFVIVPDFLVAALNKLATADKTYLFQSSNSEMPTNGTDAMKEVVTLCPDLERPDLIHAQKLRKYLATTCQILDMKENELRLVADHMGHSVNIHTSIYRLQQNLIERSKMAKILLAAEQGTLNKQGTATEMDLINIDDLKLTEESDDSSSESEATPSASHLPTTLQSTNSASMEELSTESDSESQRSTEAGPVQLDEKDSKIKRVRWSLKEKKLFADIYTNRETMPDKETMSRLKEAFPSRSILVLRARASNLKLKKCK